MAKQKIALEIGLMNLIYGLLNELSVKLPENFMSQLRVHKDEICFTLVTDVPAKTIIQVLRKRLKWQFDQFKLTITINGKLYGSSYPNIGESIIEWPYWQATKTPLVYGLSIALAPLYVTILYFFICDRLPKKFDEQVKSASDSFLTFVYYCQALL